MVTAFDLCKLVFFQVRKFNPGIDYEFIGDPCSSCRVHTLNFRRMKDCSHVYFMLIDSVLSGYKKRFHYFYTVYPDKSELNTLYLSLVISTKTC